MNGISFGQYYPGSSFVHKMDPRAKLILVPSIVIMLFLCKNFCSLGLCAAASLTFVLLSRIPILKILKGIRVVVFLVLFTAVMQLFYNTGGTVLFEWWKIKITTDGVFGAVFMTVRIVLLIITTSLLTYTTSPTALTDGLERVLSPLKVFRVRVGELAMMMTIALRFIPTLLNEVNRIMAAQKARGADFESGSIIARIRALVPIFVPLFVNSFRRAFDLANAMECRCYTGSEGRTRLKVMKMRVSDVLSLVFCAALLAGVILLNVFFEAVI